MKLRSEPLEMGKLMVPQSSFTWMPQDWLSMLCIYKETSLTSRWKFFCAWRDNAILRGVMSKSSKVCHIVSNPSLAGRQSPHSFGRVRCPIFHCQDKKQKIGISIMTIAEAFERSTEPTIQHFSGWRKRECTQTSSEKSKGGHSGCDTWSLGHKKTSNDT